MKIPYRKSSTGENWMIEVREINPGCGLLEFKVLGGGAPVFGFLDQAIRYIEGK